MTLYRLKKNEKILLELQLPSRAAGYFFLSWIWGVAQIFILLMGSAIITLFFGSRNFGPNPVLWNLFKEFFKISYDHRIFVAGIFLLTLLCLFGLSRLWVRAYSCTLTNQGLIIQSGFFWLSQRIIPFSTVREVYSQSSLIESFMGVRSVYIKSARFWFSYRGLGRIAGLTDGQSDEVVKTISAHMKEPIVNASTEFF